MYSLIEYCDNYVKTSAGLWQYCRNDPADGNAKDVEIMVPLKYVSTFWRTLEMPLINCEVRLILPWSLTFVITGAGRITITDRR